MDLSRAASSGQVCVRWRRPPRYGGGLYDRWRMHYFRCNGASLGAVFGGGSALVRLCRRLGDIPRCRGGAQLSSASRHYRSRLPLARRHEDWRRPGGGCSTILRISGRRRAGDAGNAQPGLRSWTLITPPASYYAGTCISPFIRINNRARLWRPGYTFMPLKTTAIWL